MAFSKWQEQTLVQAPSEVELPPKEVMVSQVERGVNTQTSKGWPPGEGVDAWKGLVAIFYSFSSHLPVRMISRTSAASQPSISDPWSCQDG